MIRRRGGLIYEARCFAGGWSQANAESGRKSPEEGNFPPAKRPRTWFAPGRSSRTSKARCADLCRSR